MDPGPSSSSSHGLTKQLVCTCQRYCEGKPRLLSEATFYRHLAEADEDEHHKLEAVKSASFDTARMVLANRNSLDNRAEQSASEVGPSNGISLSARRTASLQVLAKRAREDPDSQRRAGKRKCARNKENVPNIEEPQQDRTIFSPPPDPAPSPQRVKRPPIQHLEDPGGSGEERNEQPRPFAPLHSPTPPPGPDLHDQEPAQGPQPGREGPPRIEYNRRLPPPIDLAELSRITVLPKLQQHLAFITIVWDASFQDPIAKMTETMLTRLRNPPQGPIQIDNPGIRHSISAYLALEHASQGAYERVIKSTQRNFSATPGVEDCLRFGAVENLLAAYTGIEPVRHDMCPESCTAFTGPFEHLESCPTCNTSRWNQAKLEASRGRVKVPAKTFVTLPLGPQLQALYRDPDGTRAMTYLYQRTQEILDEYAQTQQIPIISDIAMGWDNLSAFLAGDIKENDIVIMASIDGAQIYKDKESDCWLYIWIVLNISPDRRYRKLHVIPGGFIPGPHKPKNIDLFMVVGLHHLSALQQEGLQIWNAARNETFRSDIYLLFVTADGPGLVHWDGLVGHCGKNGCRLYCGVRGRQKDSHSHYYPALLCPHNAHRTSNHPDISAFHIPPGGSQEYTPNLFYLMSSLNQCQFESRRTETGISKPPLILGLHPSRSLGVPICMTTDLMHLAANISNLMISIWRGDVACMLTDNIATWDWAVLRDEEIWQAHGRAVEAAGQHLPGSFDVKPCNIAAKKNTSYKTWEFVVYLFGLALGLLHNILPERYWKNLCKLVRGFQIMSQHEITHEQVLQATILLASWEHEFEEIYYQRRNDQIHFLRLCVHQVVHLGPETFQKGPPICTAQWTMERMIGNLKHEIRQPSNYLVNFANEGLRRARINALLTALPELDDSRSHLPPGAVDLGDGFFLFNKSDKTPVNPSHGTGGAIWEFLDRPNPIPKIKRWARLLLPNGQIARSAWRERLRSPDNTRVSRMIKFTLHDTILFGEVLYYTRLAVGGMGEGDLHFTNVALVCAFSRPHQATLDASYSTLPTCEATDGILVVNIHHIISVVAMVPHTYCLANGLDQDHFFAVEKPGLNVSHFMCGDAAEMVDDDDVDVDVN